MNMKKNNDIIYALNDRPPLLETIFAAMQHLLAIFVAIMTPPLIIASQLGFDLHTTSYMVSMALFASGVATFVQCRRFGQVGAGLLCIQGTSYSFIGPVIAAGMAGGPAVIFGTCMAASFVEVIIGRILRYARKIITPVVSGIVVTLIGLCLIKVGVSACGGGNAAQADGTFGSIAVVLTISVFVLIVGYVVAWAMGMIDFSSAGSYAGFYLPQPFKYGIDFDWSAFISLSIIFVITAIEAYGDITANSLISGEPVEGKVFDQRVSGGVVANGLTSFVAAVFNSFPNSIFAQNNGMIQLTGVASRYVGYFIALFLVLLGLFPAVSLVFSLMPEPVLGGATLLMFGTVATAGIRIIASQPIGRKEVLVMAVSFSLGLSVELVPDILAGLPKEVASIFSSGITTGGVAAIVSNLLIRIKNQD